LTSGRMMLQRIGHALAITLAAGLAMANFPMVRNQCLVLGACAALAQPNDALKARADRLMEKSTTELNNGQISASIQSIQAARLIYRKLGDRRREAASLVGIGIRYVAQREISRGIKFIQQALAEAQALGDDDVTRLAQQALSVAEHQQKPLVIKADQLRDNGIDERNRRNTAAALHSWRQALALYRELNDHDNELMTLGYIAQTYDDLNAYQEASDYYQRYLQVARELHNRRSEAEALGNLSLIYGALGDLDQALTALRASLAILRETKDKLNEGGALLNLGLYYSQNNDIPKSIGYYEQALNIGRETRNDVLEARALGNLGVAYYSAGDNGKAIDFQLQLLELSNRAKQPSGALAAFGNLALAYYSQGNYLKSVEYCKRAIQLARKIKSQYFESKALNNLGSILSEIGRPAEAEPALYASLKLQEAADEQEPLASHDADKVADFEERRNTYGILQKVLVAQDNPNKALEIAERGRARVFAELLNKRLTPGRGARTITPPSISQIKQVALQQNTVLIEYSIIFRTPKQKQLESEIYIWVINPNGEIGFRRSDLNPLLRSLNMTLKELVSLSRWSIGARGLPIIAARAPVLAGASHDAFQPEQNKLERGPLRLLYQLLIAPIADLLPADEKARVAFIPTGPLFLVPFAALQDEDGGYVIEKHTIYTAPSIQTLQLTHQQRRQSGPLDLRSIKSEEALVVGNPTMPSLPPAVGEKPQQLQPLPGSENEADAIAALFNTIALVGDRATKAAVEQRLPAANIIHFATHGLLDDVRGMGSAIVLAPSNGDDGLLTSDQIMNLKLNSKLVVLSACNTGRGRITGDGVIGLSRSLISAGVTSVVSSLWSIPDSPTASLMTEFYRNLELNPDKAESLRQAMLTTMKRYPDPKDWGGFILIGEPD
jgi:CHAT domain-containing protein/tetratricopeptide (TPR) repeat protein